MDPPSGISPSRRMGGLWQLAPGKKEPLTFIAGMKETGGGGAAIAAADSLRNEGMGRGERLSWFFMWTATYTAIAASGVPRPNLPKLLARLDEI